MSEGYEPKYMDGTDSGWQSLTNADVFNGTIYYRKIGDIVEVIGSQISFKAEVTTNQITMGTLPSGYYPKVYAVSMCGNSFNPYGYVLISSSGNITFWKGVQNPTYPANSNSYFNLMYFLA